MALNVFGARPKVTPPPCGLYRRRDRSVVPRGLAGGEIPCGALETAERVVDANEKQQALHGCLQGSAGSRGASLSRSSRSMEELGLRSSGSLVINRDSLSPRLRLHGNVQMVSDVMENVAYTGGASWMPANCPGDLCDGSR